MPALAGISPARWKASSKVTEADPPADVDPLADLPPHLKAILLPEQQGLVLSEVRRVITQSVAFRGPFPPPAMLDAYERHLPGFLAKLMARAEEAQQHEQEIERLTTIGPLHYARRGQWMGFAIALGSLLGAVGCAYIQQPYVGAVLGLVGLAPVIGHLVRNPLGSARRSGPSADAPAVAAQSRSADAPPNAKP